METPHIVMLPDGRMDTKNAAKYLGKSMQRMATWRCEGYGPRFTKVGATVYYFKQDLDDWIYAQGKAFSTAQARMKSVIEDKSPHLED